MTGAKRGPTTIVNVTFYCSASSAVACTTTLSFTSSRLDRYLDFRHCQVSGGEVAVSRGRRILAHGTCQKRTQHDLLIEERNGMQKRRRGPDGGSSTIIAKFFEEGFDEKIRIFLYSDSVLNVVKYVIWTNVVEMVHDSFILTLSCLIPMCIDDDAIFANDIYYGNHRWSTGSELILVSVCALKESCKLEETSAYLMSLEAVVGFYHHIVLYIIVMCQNDCNTSSRIRVPGAHIHA
ncbi:hypothetical protein RB195_012228 [Necator americanus]|uniref:Uncharacterized protein n=1 Tax=Necator americanus TaxID=51031 RepID=A0ABR1D690_NECAM